MRIMHKKIAVIPEILLYINYFQSGQTEEIKPLDTIKFQCISMVRICCC